MKLGINLKSESKIMPRFLSVGVGEMLLPRISIGKEDVNFLLWLFLPGIICFQDLASACFCTSSLLSSNCLIISWEWSRLRWSWLVNYCDDYHKLINYCDDYHKLTSYYKLTSYCDDYHKLNSRCELISILSLFAITSLISSLLQ